MKQYMCISVILVGATWCLADGYTQNMCGCRDSPPRDCYDLLDRGQKRNGVYIVYPVGYKKGIQVYCDMETSGGGWLVFQRREDGSVDFYRDWNDYQVGFGDVNGEFWLGNHFIHSLTDQGQYELRVDLEDFENETRFANYQHFRIEDGASNYQLSLSGYQGDAGDALTYHNGMQFSTKDKDSDTYGTSCAVKFKGGWWYGSCHTANLNGLYHGGEHTSYADGVNWMPWTKYHYSLKSTEMKIRPL